MTSKAEKLEKLKEIAKSKGGVCLSKKYTNQKEKYLFECKEKHRWSTTATSVIGRSNRAGTWCPVCNVESKKDTLEIFKKIAKSRGGECLSKKYTDSQTKLKFKCKCGHVWKATPGNIKNSKSWCEKCAGNIKLNIGEFHLIAEERGGKCLSEKYVNAHTKLKWKCSNGHEWKAAPNEIKKGKWCPKCSDTFGERLCRLYFEAIFNKKFPKSYPDWLSTKKGDPSELDGYCEELSIAFEHNGRQHYEFLKKWHVSKKRFNEQLEKDKIRRAKCKEKGVTLIEIPEINWSKGVSAKDFPNWLENELYKNGLIQKNQVKNLCIDLRGLYSYNYLDDMKQIAIERGGECLSSSYLGTKSKLKWKCEKGHTWLAIPQSIKKGRWCPKCAGKNVSIKDLKSLAQEKGGECLSSEYLGAFKKHLWRCKIGHEWYANPASIRSHSWCPECAKTSNKRLKYTIKDMQKWAKRKGGKCLSDEYINSKEKLIWECSKGHVWEATAPSIKKGSWCIKCYGGKD